MYLAPFYNRVFNSNPFRAYDKLEKEMFGGPLMADFKTDIQDNGDHYLLEADLPGFEKQDIKVELNNDILNIHAERHSEWENDEKKDGYIRCERSYGSFDRSFDISNVNREGIKAAYKDGVLKLTLPKKEEVLPDKQVLEIE